MDDSGTDPVLRTRNHNNDHPAAFQRAKLRQGDAEYHVRIGGWIAGQLDEIGRLGIFSGGRRKMRLEVFGVAMLLVVVGLFSGIYHMFLMERDQLQMIHTTTSTTSSGVIGIQLRLKILESAILNYDHSVKEVEQKE